MKNIGTTVVTYYTDLMQFLQSFLCLSILILVSTYARAEVTSAHDAEKQLLMLIPQVEIIMRNWKDRKDEDLSKRVTQWVMSHNVNEIDKLSPEISGEVHFLIDPITIQKTSTGALFKYVRFFTGPRKGLGSGWSDERGVNRFLLRDKGGNLIRLDYDQAKRKCEGYGDGVTLGLPSQFKLLRGDLGYSKKKNRNFKRPSFFSDIYPNEVWTSVDLEMKPEAYVFRGRSGRFEKKKKSKQALVMCQFGGSHQDTAQRDLDSAEQLEGDEDDVFSHDSEEGQDQSSSDSSDNNRYESGNESSDVDLNEYPFVNEQRDSTQKVTIGDIHGNTIKLLHFLIREGVLELDEDRALAEERYKELIRIYAKSKKLKLKDVQKFEWILKKSKILKSSPKIRLIGDDLADRGKNDLLTLLVLQKIYLASEDLLEIMISNHSLEFMRYYECLTKRGEKTDFRMSPTPSLEGMLRFLDGEGKSYADKMKDIVERFYRKSLSVVSYSGASSESLSFFSHAPVGLEAVMELQKKYNAKCGDIFKGRSIFIDCIDKINEKFRYDVCHSTDELRKTGDMSNESAILGHEEFDAVYYVTWNRDYTGLDRREKLEDGTQLHYVHGHDFLEEKRPNNVTCLDTVLGKSDSAFNDRYRIYTHPVGK
jgi:NADH:ubiquinone oxidoreductase subunit